MPTIDRTAPIGSNCDSSGSRDFGHEELPGDQRQRDDRHVDEEDRAVPEVTEQEAARDGPERAGRAGDAGPDRDGLRSLVRGEDVDDDRQRRRHDQRAGDAHDGAARDQLAHARRLRRKQRTDEEECRDRAAARPCGRTCRRVRRSRTRDRRTPASRRRRPTAAATRWRGARGRGWGSRRSGSSCRRRRSAGSGRGRRASTSGGRTRASAALLVSASMVAPWGVSGGELRGEGWEVESSLPEPYYNRNHASA